MDIKFYIQNALVFNSLRESIFRAMVRALELLEGSQGLAAAALRGKLFRKRHRI